MLPPPFPSKPSNADPSVNYPLHCFCFHCHVFVFDIIEMYGGNFRIDHDGVGLSCSYLGNLFHF